MYSVHGAHRAKEMLCLENGKMSVCINISMKNSRFSYSSLEKVKFESLSITFTEYRNSFELNKNCYYIFHHHRKSISNIIIIKNIERNSMFLFGGIHLWFEMKDTKDIARMWLERLNEIAFANDEDFWACKRDETKKAISFNVQKNKKTSLSTDWIANISNWFNKLNVEHSNNDLCGQFNVYFNCYMNCGAYGWSYYHFQELMHSEQCWTLLVHLTRIRHQVHTINDIAPSFLFSPIDSYDLMVKSFHISFCWFCHFIIIFFFIFL